MATSCCVGLASRSTSTCSVASLHLPRKPGGPCVGLERTEEHASSRSRLGERSISVSRGASAAVWVARLTSKLIWLLTSRLIGVGLGAPLKCSPTERADAQLAAPPPPPAGRSYVGPVEQSIGTYQPAAAVPVTPLGRCACSGNCTQADGACSCCSFIACGCTWLDGSGGRCSSKPKRAKSGKWSDGKREEGRKRPRRTVSSDGSRSTWSGFSRRLHRM
mmetsp:Transcript_46729/g.108565  ORF Transcript_46729/g.108565 Transcript_46729/m.108565 type:complete len:219 (+) Transcript_46729:332-988(+)